MTSPSGAPPDDLRVRHVLVPIDGSELSLQALPTARALAERLGATVHAVSVASGEDDAARLGALSAAALGVPPGDDRALVVPGRDPAEAIARRAEELGSCVVCLATHGRGRFSGAILGSVARSVLQRMREPVVVLGPSADNPGWTPRPRSWLPPLAVPRMVACVDGSETSEQVLPVAVTWARALGMSLTVLTVVEDAPPPLRPPERSHRYPPKGDPAAYVDELVQRWRGELDGVDGAVVTDPLSPANGLRLHLDERPAGLVALTTHARSGLQRALVGSDAADIVHASVAPCLVVPVRP